MNCNQKNQMNIPGETRDPGIINSSGFLILILFFSMLSSLIFSGNGDPGEFNEGHINVLDYGAKGDGKTDDTDAFQKALDKAGENQAGGAVFAPRGNYLIARHINIPTNVTLEGIWQIPTAWTQYKGTTLLAVEGEGNPDAAPFITLWTNSVIKGLTIFYPNQSATNPPKPYPWTIASGGGDNSSIIDVLIVNPYMTVNFASKPAGRHYIRNLYGQPLLKGIFIDQCYDVGRVENVHFWPFWTCGKPEMKPVEEYIFNNGESFIFGRTDWQYVSNTFSFGYKIGYHFIKTEKGPCNGNFLGIGADATQKAVVVDESYPYGLLITNGEFVCFGGEDTVHVDVSTSNTGAIQFQNCAFWGQPSRIARINGKGTVTFSGCNFQFWDYGKYKQPGIECSGGNMIINACNFQRPGKHIQINKGVESAIVSSNRFAGKIVIINKSDGDVQIGLNTQHKNVLEEKGGYIIDNFDNEPFFKTEGEWSDGSGGKDYQGISLWAYKGDGSSKAFWTPDIKEAGKYEVYIIYGGDPMNNHAKNAEFVVKSKSGEKSFTVDITQNFGKWNLLGEFEFEKGQSGYVMTSNKADGNVVADAVKFVPKKK